MAGFTKEKGLNLLKKIIFVSLFTITALFTHYLDAQTVENPIEIHVRPLSEVVEAGQSSAVIVTFRIPRGFWLGEKDRSTVIHLDGGPYLEFGSPQFPKAEVHGVPVHLGTKRVYTGEIRVIVPFTVKKNAPAGKQDIIARITYTPALSAGNLSTHINERYSTLVTISTSGHTRNIPVPEPSRVEVPPDFLVQEKRLNLPEPAKTMFHTWDEDGVVPKFLHRLFIDPPNHGKHIQTVWTPFVGSTENNGQSLGMGVALMNVTREGIMTGTLQFRGYWNEYVGASAAMEAVSCPGAFYNYWFSAQISEDRNRQAVFHMENLTLGEQDRFGFELQANAFQDPRYRFSGLGGTTDEEDQTNYTHEEFGGFLDLYWIPKDHIRLGVGGKIRSVDVKRGADRLAKVMPYTVDETRFADVPGINGATVVGERVNLIYDSRNQEFTPSSGLFVKLVAEYDQVTSNPKPVSTYGRFSAEIRKYYTTVNRKFTLLLRNRWVLTTSEQIPFFDQATLGGEASLRAFDIGRFYGQHSVFGSVELRYLAMHVVMMGFPMDLEMAPFVDFGQVFNSTDFEGDFNVNPGLSIRVLNKPNIGIVVNGAVGQDGLTYTGGVNLPF
ncbi:MAG: hypothetical protein D6748_11930 [Calditrichaeota bacterium]|nr:MAG: hypothetical protein D6748_11930 [Calditrichota bacterium]